MILLLGSAAFVGFLHSLAPGHWLPVVLVAKTRRWPLRLAVLGALYTASGHVVVSTTAGIVSVALGRLLPGGEETMERYAALMLVVFGVCYALFAYFRHSSCSGHEHHGPSPKGKKAPFLFLFGIGFSPCFAVLPLFLAASARGWGAAFGTMASFSLGVFAALAGATFAVTLGILKLDHPVFEHYGDVLTGGAVALMGVILYNFPL